MSHHFYENLNVCPKYENCKETERIEPTYANIGKHMVTKPAEEGCSQFSHGECQDERKSSDESIHEISIPENSMNQSTDSSDDDSVSSSGVRSPAYDHPRNWFPPNDADVNNGNDCVLPPPGVARSSSGAQPLSKPPVPQPRKTVASLSSEQNELFRKVPPPSSPCVSPATAPVKSFSPRSNRSVPSSFCAAPPIGPRHSLTDSVPPLSSQLDGANGYVPHRGSKPQQSEPGYLPMGGKTNTKTSSDETPRPLSSDPPFDHLWAGGFRADGSPPLSPASDVSFFLENDPEYFSVSEIYANEPLYQIYHSAVVMRDIVEQNMDSFEEDREVEYADYQMIVTMFQQKRSERKATKPAEEREEEEEKEEEDALEILMPGGPGMRRLWAETPQVKKSGILNDLSSEEKKLQESLFEVITSEASYLKSVKLLASHFMESQHLKPPTSSVITKMDDYRHLFSNTSGIVDASQKMLQALELVWRENFRIDAGKMCRSMQSVAALQKYFEAYIRYCSNAVFQERKLQELNLKPEFKTIVSELEDAPEVNGLKFQSFLLLPMQRITRMPLLIDAFSRWIDACDPKIDDVSNCLAEFQKVVRACNDGARQVENLEQMNELNNQLEFDKDVKTVSIVCKGRNLVKKGAIVLIKRQKSHLKKGLFKKIHKMVTKETTIRHFFLFNDLLIVTKKHHDRFLVLEHFPKREVDYELIDNNNKWKYFPNGMPTTSCGRFYFCLVHLDSTVERNKEFILACHSETERTRWVEALFPRNVADEDEKIYEISDCPQVQTVIRFVASEPDELGLEESDIINVLRKTNDGWYEGERMRDGRRGWFPSDHTLEIESAHMRTRNRQQRWRLLHTNINRC